MRKLTRVIDVVSYIVSGSFSGWVVVALMFLVLIEVVSRYGFRQALILSDEFGAYAVVIISYMGLAYTQKVRGHIRIEFIVSNLRPKLRNWLRVITLCMSFIFFVLLTKQALHLVVFSVEKGFKSGSWINTPLVYPQSFILIGGALICLQLIAEITYAVRAARGHGGAT